MDYQELSSVEEVIDLVKNLDVIRGVEVRDLKSSCGKVLAEDIRCNAPRPRFDQSAMDGYAVRTEDLAEARRENPVELRVTREVAAGDDPQFELARGETARIYTGAPVPEGAGAVVIQEEVNREGEEVTFFTSPPDGANIRSRGGEMERGEILLKAGELITPPAIGLGLDQDIREVRVYRQPSVAVVSTGEELVPPGCKPGPGKKIDTSSPILVEELNSIARRVVVERVGDLPDDIKTVLQKALAEHELVITLGGVSVGEKDYVPGVLEELGVEKLNHGVFQKPGKPLWIGRRDDRFVLGMPGNPASTLACFYIYAYGLLRRIAGYSPESAPLPSGWTELQQPVDRETKRFRFAWATTEPAAHGYRSEIIEKQQSHMLIAPARANSLVCLPAEREKIETEEKLKVYFLPGRS